MEFNLFNLGGLNFSGLKVEANLGARHSKGPSSLPVPLRTLGAAPSFLSCLSWHTRASRFVGRASELDALIRWCDHRSNLSLKFIRGDGGAGKSRLAAELALLLRKQGWSAGFLSDSNHEAVLGSNGKGALIVIDYPEEGPARLNAFIKRLRTVETQTKLRILCLSRQMPQAWEEVLSEAGITDFVDTDPIMLAGVAMDDAYDLFTSAMEEIGAALDTVPKPVSTAAFESWFARDAFHANPLYLVAAAARAAFMPNEPSLSFVWQDAIRALARKEQDRLRRLAEARGLPSQAFVEIAAGALLQEGLPKSDLTRFTSALADPFSLTLPDVTLDAISRTDDTGLIHFDMPDILAACFVAQALRASRAAGDLLWVASTLRSSATRLFYSAGLLSAGQAPLHFRGSDSRSCAGPHRRPSATARKPGPAPWRTFVRNPRGVPGHSARGSRQIGRAGRDRAVRFFCRPGLACDLIGFSEAMVWIGRWAWS